ncbi:MAG: hypothetical protein M3042_06870 [Actinomycetota bacterium]|nr:hypothetical protein [Actinomycetota bacterium]
MSEVHWPERWTGRWIWDRAPDEVARFPFLATPTHSHYVYVRRTFVLDQVPAQSPVRATCDSRYLLFVNGHQIGRGPIRSEPEFLGWDDYDIAGSLRPGANVVVALCRYYGRPGPWWVPAPPFGTLGRGSFCLDAGPGAPAALNTGPDWRTAPAPWLPDGAGSAHGLPPEVVDGRLVPAGLHDPAADDSGWSPAVVVSGEGHGTVLDRPPAAPYTSPLRRPIPALTSVVVVPRRLDAGAGLVHVEIADDPVTTWRSLRRSENGDRVVSVWACPRLTLGHVRLTVRAPAGAAGAMVDVVAGEELRPDRLPEIRPREWTARYLVAGDGSTAGDADEQVAFFDPVGLQYLAVHHPAGIDVSVDVEETGYPRAEGASFDCDDQRYNDLWRIGARTVDACSTDAFLDCPGREQRAWVSDAYPQTLVALVSNPDWALVRHHLRLAAASRQPGGLLAGAAACDFSRSGVTMPEYSLHWLRTLAAYWWQSGDEEFVRGLMPVADAIIERYERQRGAGGLLEDFPGWVFLDWAQVDRGTVIGAHDGLYAAALEDYAGLPGAGDVSALVERTRAGFEALWDPGRGVYVDAIGDDGPRRRISQHTNAAVLLAGLVPAERVAGVIEAIMDPAGHLGGRLVVTPTSADVREGSMIPTFQYQQPEGFDEETDVVAAQPWFCRFLHEALFRHGRRDLILANLLRWPVDADRGTFEEFWSAEPGMSSRCHGWAASPTYDLTAYVLGVRPAVPGFGRAVVDPYLGPLHRASGRVPTPHGWLSVRVDASGVDVDAPPGVTVLTG